MDQKKFHSVNLCVRSYQISYQLRVLHVSLLTRNFFIAGLLWGLINLNKEKRLLWNLILIF